MVKEIKATPSTTSAPSSVPQSKFATHYTVNVPTLSPASVTVANDGSGQHTLSWTVPICLKGSPASEALPAGSCNLYLFPAVKDVDGVPLTPSNKQLDALKALVVGLVASPACEFATVPDLVGAMPIHAVTVANTDEALVLSEMMFDANPKLLLSQVHVDHRAGFPLFAGESSLHICCVNRREKLLLKLIELMMLKLPRGDALALLRSQAAGVFFNEMPMREYGGTVLAYALCFSLKEAVVRLLETGLVSLNEKESACVITGFLPLHAVTANGLSDMYDWMTTTLPAHQRAIVEQRTVIGRLKLGTNGLTPVQLAAKLGDHTMVKHILRKQCDVLWVWGPVTQFSINLAGVDSAGEGGGDIMELVARVDAKRETTELVLDDFCQGFIYMLFKQKWSRFGYKLYYLRLALDLFLAALLIVVAFAVKENPSLASPMKPLCVVMLVLMVLLVFEELRVAYLYKLNYQGDGDARIPMKEMRGQIVTFCKLHWVHVLLLSYAFTAISCVLILLYDLEDAALDLNATFSGATRRALKSGGSIVADIDVSYDTEVTLGSLGSFKTMHYAGDTYQVNGVLWLTLFAAIFLMMPYLAFKIFTPSERFNIFVLSVVKMLKRDLMVFLLLFLFFMLTFYISLYILYPRAGSVFMPQVTPFNSLHSSLRSLVELAFTGSPAAIDLEADFRVLSTSQCIDFGVFLVVYVFFIILSLILLLNLLIAMLSFTFEMVTSESTLQHRTSFAQSIMRLELQAVSIGLNVNVGDDKGNGTYTYDFRSVESLAVTDTGGKEASEGDPFAIPDLPPLSRIEMKLEELESKLSAMLPSSTETTAWSDKARVSIASANVDPVVEDAVSTVLE